jgi:hypothetical protein
MGVLSTANIGVKKVIPRMQQGWTEVVAAHPAEAARTRKQTEKPFLKFVRHSAENLLRAPFTEIS